MDDDIKPKLMKTYSMRSVRSAKSTLDYVPYNTPVDDKPLDLDDFIAMACRKFLCPCNIIVKKELQMDEYSKMNQESAIKYKKINLAGPYAKLLTTPDSEKEEIVSTATRDGDAMTITAFYDNAGRLAEIILKKLDVPRMLMQILGLITPRYMHLTKLVLKKCCIYAHTIYEISKFLSLTTITEICLDGSPVPEGNYALLLEGPSKLSNLSLCRCAINDQVCQQIASKLHFMELAGQRLEVLNLSSNHITDVGAKYLGEALRSNRHLRYLNLADNRISDEGANHIFHALIDFPLTYDETMGSRRKFMAYLRNRRLIYLKCMAECDSRSLDNFSMITKKPVKKPNTTSIKNKAKKEKMKINGTDDEFIHIRAEMMANEILGNYIDPFIPRYTRFINGYSHCIGNMVLCYLNLSYNNLSFLSLKKLQIVLSYQSVNKMPNQTGLMRVLIEGNQLPFSCEEINRVSELLRKNIVSFSAKYIANKLKARTRVSVIQVKK